MMMLFKSVSDYIYVCKKNKKKKTGYQNECKIMEIEKLFLIPAVLIKYYL